MTWLKLPLQPGLDESVTPTQELKEPPLKSLLKVAAVVGSLAFAHTASADMGISFAAASASGTSVTLAAGTYSGHWTGGGWSAWSSGDNWLNAFLVTTTGGTTGFGTGSFPWYSSPAAALNAVNGMSFSFVVPTTQNVKFTVADNVFGDNRGSLSISIAPIPEPETYALMLAGLGLLGFIARRRRNG